MSCHVSHATDCRRPTLAVGHDEHNVAVICHIIVAINTAHNTLLYHVTSLNSWIIEAETIRAAAEAKAKEAYDKLKVNQTLDANVKKIVAAKEEIEKVHGNLGKVHGNLGAWKTQARSVLQGAIDKATEVHDALDIDGKGDKLKTQIEGIDSARQQIVSANSQLGNHVSSLGKWRDAAKDVIKKADEKCKEILEKVSTKSPESVIYQQSGELQKKGTTLLRAAQEAKKAVAKQVGEALKAVVAMDTDLKRDLKSVKNKLKKGIEDVIRILQVNELGNKVKDDLGTLRQKIEGLKNNMDDDSKPNELVKQALENLAEEKQTLEKVTHKDTGSIKREMDKLYNNFKTAIQNPLDTKVSEVDSAIVALGGKFGIQPEGDKKKLHKIFDKIKEEVGKIKGTPNPKAGLEGIVSGLQNYAKVIGNNVGKTNGGTVSHWVMRILNGNVLVGGWIDEYVSHNNGNFQDSTVTAENQKAAKVKTVIQNKIQERIRSVKPKPTGTKDVGETLKEIQAFHNAVSQTIKAELAPDKADEIAGKVKSDVYYAGGGNKIEHLQGAIKSTLAQLPVLVKNSGDEINTFADSNAALAKLDGILQQATTLHGQLKAATNPDPPTATESPAEAVDSKLNAVREFVDGKNSDKDLAKIFNEKVTDELTKAVKELPGAVSTFNQQAQTQIRAAAKKAITAAAEEIKTDSSGINLKDTMSNFHNVYKDIHQLEEKLNGQVDEHIGKDDNQAGGTGVTADKVTITKDNFGKYYEHVKQDSDGLMKGYLKGESDEGKLPEVIGKIKAEVYNALQMIEPGFSSSPRVNKIDKDTFEKPAKAIEKELRAIKELVDDVDGEVVR
ncbi:Extracellular matrix-binding ebh, putative [Babesia ovata]|uniref:Extracellular matrix-binding ebh, putative n=1 Tax=Babesia ovata TaxID=189622 RepID=A0A2H6KF69_9APIC|nr:Extracellular matrix-binding ebh, putative [Babesia ovata]GBE61624.1 Extracellular matrix-binding ebh, putative [Babesia ovata]